MPKQTKKKQKDTRDERSIQIECVKWFRETFPNQVITVISNEALARNWARYEPMGAVAGVGDILVSLKNNLFFIEMKNATGKQSQAQKDFEAKCNALGIGYYLCRDLDSFKRSILAEWVKMQKIDPQQHKNL